MRNLGRIFLCLALAALAAGCTEWNSGLSTVNSYVAGETTTQQGLLQKANDNRAAALLALGPTISYGAWSRLTTLQGKAIAELYGVPSGLALVSTDTSGVTSILTAGGYVKTSDAAALRKAGYVKLAALPAALRAEVTKALGETAATSTTATATTAAATPEAK